MKITYHFFCNDEHTGHTTGIVTFASKEETKDGKTYITTGYHLTNPDEEYNEQHAKEQAKSMMSGHQCVVSVGHASSGELMDTVRVGWENVRLLDTDDLPVWTKNLDLATKAQFFMPTQIES